jgi:selenocysteine lyase/cysteine desulfurase
LHEIIVHTLNHPGRARLDKIATNEDEMAKTLSWLTPRTWLLSMRSLDGLTIVMAFFPQVRPNAPKAKLVGPIGPGYHRGMTINELFADEELRRQEFPVTRDKVFLAHAGVCPLPRVVSEAIRDYALQSTLGDQETLVPAFRMGKTRALAASLLHAKAEEISFVGPTSLALSMVAAGLPWRKNDNIVVYLDDFPSNVYPWMALAEKGVQVRGVMPSSLGKIEPIDILTQIDEQTRLVALASCHFASGFRIDLNEIGQLLHSLGVLFCVDGIQTLGAFPTTVEHIDFLAADAHKWMLGPCAAGILYVRQSLQDRLKPTLFGWNNVKSPSFIAAESIELEQGGQRYEPGSANLLGLVGLHAAMELIEGVGVESIAAELLRKRTWLIPALRERGFGVLGANSRDKNASGIIGITHPKADMGVVQKVLAARGIIASERCDRAGRKYLRISPHFYNTDNELIRFLDCLAETAKSTNA